MVGLSVYWPAIFIATHIPVPSWVGQAGMGDKTLHFLSYLGLITLVWFAVSPYEKVNWFRAKVWIILAVIVWYGAIDEWLQGFVGRQPEVKDFYADIGAALLGLTIMSIFSFWGSVLVLCSIFIFVITNLTRGNLLFGSEMLNAAFCFLAYSLFTLVWIQFAERHIRIRSKGLRWLGVYAGVPAVVLGGMKLSSLAFGKSIWYMDAVTAVSAIVVTVLVSYVTFLFCRRKKGGVN
jgi:VanZ family protein